MLSSLRLVMSTVTSNFDEEHFLSIPMMNKTQGEIEEALLTSDNQEKMVEFLDGFVGFVGGRG